MIKSINKYLVIFTMLVLVSCPVFSQDDSGASAEQTEALQSITSLGNRICAMIRGYFASLEALALDEELITAIQDDNRKKLDEFESAFRARLQGSLKVRIYIKGKEEVDNIATPACGFACIEIVRNAYQGNPPAEALLFRSADANIMLARAVKNKDGRAIGAIVSHYPFSLLRDEINKLTIESMYTELRQAVTGPIVVLYNHGNRTIKKGTAQKVVRIPKSRWIIGVWTPGGVAVEDYIEPPELPWMYIIAATIVLIVGIAILVIYRIKHPVVKKPTKVKHIEPVSAEAMSYDFEHDESPTLIRAGGAKDIDVSQYLKDSDITDLKKKLEK